MALTDEQATHIGNIATGTWQREFGNERDQKDAAVGRAAYDACRPLILAEALAEPDGKEETAAWSASKGELYAYARLLFANRLKRLTAKEPTLVEKVEAILMRRGVGACPSDTAAEIAALLEKP